MKSNWRVRAQSIAGTDFFQVYRKRDVCDVTKRNNIETRGGLYSTEAEAQLVADNLNEEARNERMGRL